MFAVLGVFLLVIGAIVTFAIEREAEGVDLVALGWILMGAGAISLLIGLMTSAAWWSARPTRARYERHVTPDGTFIEDSQIG